MAMCRYSAPRGCIDMLGRSYAQVHTGSSTSSKTSYLGEEEVLVTHVQNRLLPLSAQVGCFLGFLQHKLYNEGTCEAKSQFVGGTAVDYKQISQLKSTAHSGTKAVLAYSFNI